MNSRDDLETKSMKSISLEDMKLDKHNLERINTKEFTNPKEASKYVALRIAEVIKNK